MSELSDNSAPANLRRDFSPVVVAERLATRSLVEFATEAGVVQTLEGPVSHEAGAAIVTGAEGERWPVSLVRFTLTYDAEPETMPGCAGYYRRKPQRVLAHHLSEAAEVVLSGGRGTLLGKSGDWIVEYSPGDRAVIEGSIFAQTYRLVERPG